VQELALADAEHRELISMLARNSTARAFYERRSERIRELVSELQTKSLPPRETMSHCDAQEAAHHRGRVSHVSRQQMVLYETNGPSSMDATKRPVQTNGSRI
jgi:hypothetical protein